MFMNKGYIMKKKLKITKKEFMSWYEIEKELRKKRKENATSNEKK